MFGVGAGEVLVILLVALLVVGPERLPKVSHNIGRAIRELRRVQGEAQQQFRSALDLEGLAEIASCVEEKLRGLGLAPQIVLDALVVSGNVVGRL